METCVNIFFTEIAVSAPLILVLSSFLFARNLRRKHLVNKDRFNSGAPGVTSHTHNIRFVSMQTTYSS